MGTKGAEMVARPPAANIKMADLAEWWKDISASHGVRIQVTWEMTGLDELAMWRFTVRTFKAGTDAGGAPYDVKSLVWPTANHKTVLGALLWLLLTVDDELLATEALTGRG
jgi:hypothetical protein